jgi:NAD(P)-dependent dehydrogenase (short-subunit alcohol dehydrogenase family)
MKIALITGVSRKEGIGYTTAKQLGNKGYRVILAARNLKNAESLVQHLVAQGIEASAIMIDLLDRSSILHAARDIREKFGKLDVLINNAALMITSTATIEEKDMDELDLELRTNVTGTWYVTQQFLPLLVASGQGRIVNISSSMGSFSEPGFGLIDYSMQPIPAYAITKLVLNGLTVKMAKEFKAHNILVNAVCPDFTATRPGFAEYGARPVDESIDGIVWAATLSDDGPNGQFFRDKKPIYW